MNVAAIASVAPQHTVISRSGSTVIPYQFRYFSAIASLSAGLPHVIAYWLMSPLIAAHAASFIGSGIGKSGNPCARLIAPYWFATRVISRITDSVKVLARLAVAARLDVFWVSVITLEPELRRGKLIDKSYHFHNDPREGRAGR